MNWDNFRLEQLCLKVQSGGTPPTSMPDYYGGTIDWIKTKEVNFCKIYEAETKITELGLSKSSAKMIPENSIIIAMYGNGDTAGRCAMNLIPVATNQACCNLTFNEEIANPFFMYYKISSHYKDFVNLKSGGAQLNLNSQRIKEFEINLPPLETQKRIASILSNYDDLIENNLKRIKLLEETAQNIYKEWFVNFRFPNYEHTEFDKESGLPVGWEMKTLNDVIEFKVDNRGRNPEYYSEKGIPVIDNFLLKDSISVNLSNCKRYIDETIFESFIRKYLEPNDVLITLVGNLGSISLAPQTKTVIIQNTIGLRCNNLCSQFFLYCFLLNSKTKIQNMNRGVAQPSVLVGDLFNLQIALPKINYINDFSSIIEPVFNMVNTLTLQNQNLKEARDILLPRLMNRTIEV